MSRRITAVVLTLAVFLCLMAATPLFAQSDDEAAAPAFEFTILEDGEPVEDTFEDNITARIYAFFGSEGDEVTISMSGDLDSYVVLFGDEGQFLTFDDDGGEAGSDSLISDFELPYDGTYYVIALPYSYVTATMVDSLKLSSPLAYELELSGNTVPADLEADAVPNILAPTLEAGETAGELTAEAPIGYFSFAGEAGDVISVDFNYDKTISYPMLYLFGPDGSRVTMSESLDDTSEADVLDYELPEDGNYLVVVLDKFFVDIDEDSDDYGIGTFKVNFAINA